MKKFCVLCFLFFVWTGLSAANTETDSSSRTGSDIRRKVLSRLTLGGYGEVAMARNFYSDNGNRYSHAADYADAPGHGRFDIPHVVLVVGYDFGKGWKFNSEIEFEHGGAGGAVELEAEEAGEFETEVERGGEVALEQFYIEKSFFPWLNLRIGEQIVPVGAVNARHLPTEFFTVYRPEGEYQLLPCTWHQIGIELWGRKGDWRYEIMFLPGLNSAYFSKDQWVKNGTKSPFEFFAANKYAAAARVENTSVKGLRLSLSGYYGHSFNNTLQADASVKYAGVKGAVAIGCFDFEYKNKWLTLRGNALYGHLGDAAAISQYNRSLSKTSPYKRTFVGKAAWTAGGEFGIDFFAFSKNAKVNKQKFILFNRWEYYDAYIPCAEAPAYNWTDRLRTAAGINYYPIPQVAFKIEFSERFLRPGYNNEPSINIGVVYAAYFTKG